MQQPTTDSDCLVLLVGSGGTIQVSCAWALRFIGRSSLLTFPQLNRLICFVGDRTSQPSVRVLSPSVSKNWLIMVCRTQQQKQQHYQHQHHQQPAYCAHLSIIIFILSLSSLVEARSSWQQHLQDGEQPVPPDHHHYQAPVARNHQIADTERLLAVVPDREQLDHHRRKDHRRYHRVSPVDLEYDSVPDNESYDDYEDDNDQGEEEENVAGSSERIPAVFRALRLRHPHQQRVPVRRWRRERHQGHLIDPLELAQDNYKSSGRQSAHHYRPHRSRGKRHGAASNGPRYKNWTEQDWVEFEKFRQGSLSELYNRHFEIEVREAQNSSLCNYTVIPIPDPGGRIPRELEHVKCNHVGSRCQDEGTYCCLQTYRNMQVAYKDGKSDTIKVYSGCVCSLQLHATLKPYVPNLPTNDWLKNVDHAHGFVCPKLYSFHCDFHWTF